MLDLNEVGKQLGLRANIPSVMALVEKSRQGLQPAAFTKIAQNLEIEEKTLSGIVSTARALPNSSNVLSNVGRALPPYPARCSDLPMMSSSCLFSAALAADSATYR